MNTRQAKAVADELEEVSGELSRMGGIVEDMLEKSMRAVVGADREMAADIVRRDADVDAIEADIEKRVLRLLEGSSGISKPDSRLMIAALKASGDLERVGDLAKNIAKRTLAVDVVAGDESGEMLRSLSRMGRLVFAQLKGVLDAFSTLDLDAAAVIWARDEEVDEHYNTLFRVLLTYMMGDPRTIGACTHMLFMAKNLERIGDHCTNIAESIHFLVTGDKVTTQRPKIDDLDEQS